MTFSIANGVSFGVIAYVAISVFSGRARGLKPLLYVIAALLVIWFAWLGG